MAIKLKKLDKDGKEVLGKNGEPFEVNYFEGVVSGIEKEDSGNIKLSVMTRMDEKSGNDEHPNGNLKNTTYFSDYVSNDPEKPSKKAYDFLKESLAKAGINLPEKEPEDLTSLVDGKQLILFNRKTNGKSFDDPDVRLYIDTYGVRETQHPEFNQDQHEQGIVEEREWRESQKSNRAAEKDVDEGDKDLPEPEIQR